MAESDGAMKRLLLAFLIILMPGCASVDLPTAFSGYCALKPLSADNGIMFVMAYCKAQE